MAVVEAAVAGAERMELVGGEVLQARHGIGATGRKASCARGLRYPLDARSRTMARTGPNGHRGRAGDEARRRRDRALAVRRYRRLGEAGEGASGAEAHRGGVGSGQWARGSARRPESSPELRRPKEEEELGEVDAVAPGSNDLDRSTQRTTAERHVIGARREVDGERGIERRRSRTSAQIEPERGTRGKWGRSRVREEGEGLERVLTGAGEPQDRRHGDERRSDARARRRVREEGDGLVAGLGRAL
jgi:hypothetical protein